QRQLNRPATKLLPMLCFKAIPLQRLTGQLLQVRNRMKLIGYRADALRPCIQVQFASVLIVDFLPAREIERFRIDHGSVKIEYQRADCHAFSSPAAALMSIGSSSGVNMGPS